MKRLKISILALSLLAFTGTASAVDWSAICCDGGFEYRHPSNWEKEQQRLRDELAAAKKQLADREKEIAALRSSSSEALRLAQVDIDKSKAQIAELERQLADRDKELAGLRSSSGDALRSSQSDLDQSKARIAELERQLADRDKELAGLRSSSGDALRSAQADLDQCKARVAELERHLADGDKAVAGLRSSSGDALRSAQAELDQSKTRIAELERQLSADLAAANRRVAALESQLAALQASSDEKGKQVADLESKLADRDKELAGLRGELSAEMAKLKEAQRGLIKALRPQIEKKVITVDLNNERLLINLTSGYLFGSGEDELKSAGADALKQVGAILKDFPEYKVSVDGHTDNRPIRSALKKKFPTNKELSEARAANAAQALTEGGLGAAETHGYADTRPVAPNTTDAGRAQNRRVEVRVTK